jgi:hypothetical protein
MAAAVVVVSLTLQFLLYWQPFHLNLLTSLWLTVTLPRVVLIGFGYSLIVGVVTETRRLIGGALLTSVVVGTSHRPVRKQLIVMFLDIARSTGFAEAMGELRERDLITRFFFDIDEPISDRGGAVHAYVGDEVIVSWRLPSIARATRATSCVSLRLKARWLASRPTIVASLKLRRPSAPGCTPVPSLSANAGTPNASSPFSATP